MGEVSVEVVDKVGHLWHVEDAELFSNAARTFAKDCYAKSKVAGTGVFAHLERKGLPKR